MSLFDIFKSVVPPTPAGGTIQAPVPPAGPTQVVQPGQPLPTTQVTPGSAPNGLVPAGTTANAPAEQSPFASFADIWNTDPNASVDAPIFSGLDPAKIHELAKSQDFTKQVTAEQLAAIGAGGEGAMKAFTEALKSATQSVYAESALSTTKIVEAAMKEAGLRYDKRIPGMVKKMSINDNLRTQNPLLDNPAVRPILDALVNQLTQKNPNASQHELQSQALDYVAQLGKSFGPKPEPTAAEKALASEYDWSKFE